MATARRRSSTSSTRARSTTTTRRTSSRPRAAATKPSARRTSSTSTSKRRAGATGPGKPPVESSRATAQGPGLTAAPPPTDPARANAPAPDPATEQTTSSLDDAPATVQVPVNPDDPNGKQRTSTVEPAPAQVDTVCPSCGRAPTLVTIAPRVAANPPVNPDTGKALSGGETIHVCGHCGTLIAVVSGKPDAAAKRLQTAWERDQAKQAKAAGIAPDPATTT